MGHYRSEMMSDDEFKRENDWHRRCARIRKKLEKTPLSRFTASHLDALLRVMTLDIHKSPNCRHVKELERVFAQKKKRGKK